MRADGLVRPPSGCSVTEVESAVSGVSCDADATGGGDTNACVGGSVGNAVRDCCAARSSAALFISAESRPCQW
jgi:hypothetical protein